ncbi:glycosyltransferase family 4 protein [Thermodesulfobacteriota bacterium]
MDILYLTGIKGVQFRAFQSIAEQHHHNIHLIGGKREYRGNENICLHEPNQLLAKIRKRLSAYSIFHENYHIKKALPGILRTLEPDIIHAIGVNTWGFVATENRISFFPIIVTCQGNDVYRYPFLRKRNFSRTRAALQKADIVHVLSAFTAGYLADLFDIPTEKIITGYWGLDLEAIDALIGRIDRDQARKDLGFTKSDFVFFLPRGMRPEFRPVKDFILAIAPLVKESQAIKLILLMHGSDKKLDHDTRQAVSHHGLENNVVFIDQFQPHSEIIKMFAVSDATVSIAENDETCSAVLEAMYCGSIPILSNTPTYRDRFENGTNVLFVNHSDPQEMYQRVKDTIANGSDIKMRMSSLNRQLIYRDYNREKNLPLIQKLYTTACAKRRSF